MNETKDLEIRGLSFNTPVGAVQLQVLMREGNVTPEKEGPMTPPHDVMLRLGRRDAGPKGNTSSPSGPGGHLESCPGDTSVCGFYGWILW